MRREESAAEIISIHSPLRGETARRYASLISIYISIHSPLRGETFVPGEKRHNRANFNPLASERRDPVRMFSSITGIYFNPLASERRDLANAYAYVVGVAFQSTRL